MIVDFSQRWNEIAPLLDRLFDVPAAERNDWLRRQGTDPELRTLVTRALDNASAIDVLGRDIAQWLPTQPEAAVDVSPSVPGYRVRRFVGSGGMASVFEAERALPGGTQTVALKLLRINVHDPQERARFLREQRILARLQHAHIAQLLDAGFTQTGTPFLALEFVAGEDLVTHCERRGLGVRERLALFGDVCAAVEHAHRNLIVHRDLKPRNVLVSAEGCVKLVDFGIAKLLTGEDGDTRTDARRLTRWYAAPEQIAGGAATTAIDEYALGVLLAELLGGRRYCASGRADHVADRDANGDGAFGEVQLRREFGADLHAIVSQATQADPVRRYATVAALREDVERHLQGRPLRARADTFAYRTVKFARRHAVSVAAAAGVAVALAVATAVSLHEAHRAHHAARDARTQARVAQAEARRADAVKSFLEGLFDSAEPGVNASETAEQLLARGRERAERDFATQPALRVEILALIGDLERRSGHPHRAREPLEKAAALAHTQFGPADRRTLHVEYLLAKDSDELGRAREAATRLRRAVDAYQAGPDRGSREEVRALAWVAGLDERIGRSTKAIALGDDALAQARRVLPRDSDALTEAVENLGWILLDAGRADRAEPLLREALARKRFARGEQHPDVAEAMMILSSALLRLGRYGESEQLLRDALKIDASVYTGPHPHVAGHLNNLANVLALQGKLTQAEALYEKSIAMDRALAPASSLNEAVTLANLARLRYRQGRYAEAESTFRDAIRYKQRLLGADYADNGRSYDRAGLAEVLIARHRFSEARTLIDQALSEARRRHRSAHPDTAFALRVEAELERARGRSRAAATDAGNAVAVYAALSDSRSDKSIQAHLLYGEILQDRNRYADARRQFERALTAARATVPASTALEKRATDDLTRIDARRGG